ncbi:hypothetical protein ASF91_14395 [Rhizobium sp. Leaf155]|nr:hypothetical protein ASF91_14395 [Rhizobium sp. Leaf155]
MSCDVIRSLGRFNQHGRMAGYQHLGAFGLRCLQDLPLLAGLNNTTVSHHGDTVARLGDDTEIVRDKNDGEPALIAQVQQKMEDLRLDCNVKRRGRLIGDRGNDPSLCRRRPAGSRAAEIFPALGRLLPLLPQPSPGITGVRQGFRGPAISGLTGIGGPRLDVPNPERSMSDFRLLRARSG